jgi:hypothetical protein
MGPLKFFLFGLPRLERDGQSLAFQRRRALALQYTQAHDMSLHQSFCGALIGLVEVKLGHLNMAQQHIRAGLPGLSNTVYIVVAIYGLAALEAAGERRERAVELAALVHHHQATPYEVKVYARELLAELQAVLPPDVYATAVERGAALDPDAVAAAFLQEENS